MKVVIISSSPRKGRLSHRSALLLAKKFNQIPTLETEIIDLLELEIPLFTELYSAIESPSKGLQHLSTKINEADGIILLTPEYNGSYSSYLKNAIDHFPKSYFQRKVFGIVTISTGIMGGMRAALQLQQLIPALFGIASPQMLLVPQIDKKINENGELIDESFSKSVDGFIQEYVWLLDAVYTKKIR